MVARLGRPLIGDKVIALASVRLLLVAEFQSGTVGTDAALSRFNGVPFRYTMKPSSKRADSRKALSSSICF